MIEPVSITNIPYSYVGTTEINFEGNEIVFDLTNSPNTYDVKFFLKNHNISEYKLEAGYKYKLNFGYDQVKLQSNQDNVTTASGYPDHFIVICGWSCL